MKYSILLILVLFYSADFIAQEETNYLEYMTNSLPDSYAKSNASLFFTVQIAALKNRNKSLENLKNMNIYKEEDNLTKYRIGEFVNYKDAVEYKKMLLSVCKGAFIVPVKNGKRIHIKEALKESLEI